MSSTTKRQQTKQEATEQKVERDRPKKFGRGHVKTWRTIIETIRVRASKMIDDCFDHNASLGLVLVGGDVVL
jgi:hypothetical protein